MKDATPGTIHLKDYSPPDFLIDTVDLRVEIGPADTRVQARLALRRNPGRLAAPLLLHGRDLILESVALDGVTLPHGRYQAMAEGLTIDPVPERFQLELVTRIHPERNSALEGLYRSGAMLCTQCEPEGFRRITYFLDRPDVMARYRTTIVADRARYPVLLSNGNPVERGDLPDGRHWVRWEDPFPKPSYLFALVAGDLVEVADRFVTRSGREVALRFYVERQNADRCAHALHSLRQAMRWDEDIFGLEYDLDIYMVVAVDSFNMGAMENKGLNVFNSKYVLARPDTATDADYLGIQGVIGHEYFHNWTGNRITCRDWFQLSLKEGLTVFRDQEFSADMNSRPLKRVEDVRRLRTVQFAEDAGPMAHPVRPASYIEINNFYTPTVYEKGAELIRMQRTLLGAAGFRRGMDLYIGRHDGQAVTTDDFVGAMEDANGADLRQFRLWYEQAGTPRIDASDAYDPERRRYTLTLRQSCPPTPGQPEKAPLHIPVAMGLLDSQGRELPLRLEGEAAPGGTPRVLELRQAEQSFHFEEVPEAPVPSLLRGFCAPVRLSYPYTEAQLAFLLAHDSDLFNRWEAGQSLATRALLRLVAERQAGREPVPDEALAAALGRVLEGADADPAMAAEILTLPGESYLADQMAVADVDAIHAARRFLRRALASHLRERLLSGYRALHEPGPYRFDSAAVGRRSLKNLCLGYLMELADEEIRGLCQRQYREAGNMTDRIAALGMLSGCDCPEREPALADFERTWAHDPLVLDKWFALQATSPLPGRLATVRRLMGHPGFDFKNPNRLRALVGSFCGGNPVQFHAATGEGYEFLTEQVLALYPLNPQVSARLLNPMTRWRRYHTGRQALMRAELERILAAPGLPKDVYEVVAKSLAG